MAGFFLAPADVARLLTFAVIGLGLRDLIAPKDGRAPSLLVLVVGIWLAIVAYGIWRLDVLSALPLLVALIGLALVFQRIMDGRRAAQPSEGELLVIAGSCVLDLSDARRGDEPVDLIIQGTAILGSVEVVAD